MMKIPTVPRAAAYEAQAGSEHDAVVAVDRSPLFGRTYQARCGFYRGPFIRNEHRARAFAVEAINRAAGRSVIAR